MKTTIPFLCSLLAGAAVAASGTAGFGATANSAAATDSPAPEISLALRGLFEDALEQGEPLRVTVRLESSGAGHGRVELAPAAGTWVDAVAVELRAASGGAVIARGTAVGAPASSRATLDREHVAGGMWLFAGSATQSLPRGDYIVRARLDLKGGAGWTGEVSSDDAPFSLVAVSDAPERVSARTLARAQIAFSQGQFQEAARLLDAVLAKSPDDFELLCLRADVALAGRNPTAAMICVSRAARILSPQSSGPPPHFLHEVQQRVFAAQLARDAAPGGVPEWTWPPAVVLKVSEKEATDLLAKAAGVPVVAAAAVQAGGGASPRVAAPPQSSKQRPTPPPGVSSAAPQKTAPEAGLSALTTDPNVSSKPSIGTIVASAELADAKIRADPSGQWAASATAGTQYGRTGYSAAQATGAPNVPVAGNSPDAWCPAVRDKGGDWLEVTFAKPVRATELRVRQNDAAGALAKVEAIEPNGTAHVWWEGVDPHRAPGVRDIVWFAVRVPTTPYLVARVKLTLNLASGPGYKQIDAVQLVGATP